MNIKMNDQYSKQIELILKTARRFNLCVDFETAEILALNGICAAGASGGKDSAALSIVLDKFLREINFKGEKILIHSDLGKIEHADSLPACMRLSEKIGWELVVVKPRIDMIGRWYQRHQANTDRYIDLSCVKMITPWSSSSLRFCSSEMKVAPITSYLKKRFPGQAILNAVGIRGEESPQRKKQPASKINKLLTVKTIGTYGRDWFAIRDYMVEDVWLVQRRENFCGHEGYDKNGNSRISCSCCVLANKAEILASLNDERNHEAYRAIVKLEIISTYSFSQSFYAGDVAPWLLDAPMLDNLQQAKEIAGRRILIESEIPEDLKYVAGWPTFQPSREQCALIADVRMRLGNLMGLAVKHIDWRGVHRRYAELLVTKAQKDLQKALKAEKAEKTQAVKKKKTMPTDMEMCAN